MAVNSFIDTYLAAPHSGFDMSNLEPYMNKTNLLVGLDITNSATTLFHTQ